jgi:hypothetical protein
VDNVRSPDSVNLLYWASQALLEEALRIDEALDLVGNIMITTLVGLRQLVPSHPSAAIEIAQRAFNGATLGLGSRNALICSDWEPRRVPLGPSQGACLLNSELGDASLVWLTVDLWHIGSGLFDKEAFEQAVQWCEWDVSVFSSL